MVFPVCPLKGPKRINSADVQQKICPRGPKRTKKDQLGGHPTEDLFETIRDLLGDLKGGSKWINQMDVSGLDLYRS